MTNKSELYKEARRCADRASRGVSPAMDNMFGGLARFYGSLAETEPDERRDADRASAERRPKTTDHGRLRM